MRTSRTVDRRLGLALLATLFILLVPTAAAYAQEPRFKALVFSKTTGFRHTDAINAGIPAIRALAEQHNFSLDATEDSAAFTEHNLAQYDVVVWLNSDGENVLTNPQEVAFEHWFQRGGGSVAIHAASNMNRDWAWFADMHGGAQFRNHAGGANQFQTGTVKIEDPSHPSTTGLPGDWSREDEWYNHTNEPRGKVHVLATLDENTIFEDDGNDPVADDHPISWCSNYDGGRSFYTAMGHHGRYYDEPHFRTHLLGAIEWAAGAKAGNCGAEREGIPSDSSFDKVALDTTTENPMEIAVAPDLDVYYVELAGKVKHYDAQTQNVRVIGTIPVHRGNENGLLGIALDPSFSVNRWMYLFYSVPSPEIQRVSRFTVAPDGSLDLSSEKKLLEFPHQRIICCHSSGSMDFGPDGNLYVSTGDDSQHATSQGFNPIDDRLANEPGDNPDADHARDARRTSGNTNDLRGKILRIRPLPNPGDTPGPGSTYLVPSGNLFDEALDPGNKTRPEIYTMGHRNPFRIAVDPETGWLYNGEVGPDAQNPIANRGPRGYDELNQIREAGNMGWPYCIADNKAYHDWDFTTLTSGGAFDCEGGPTNDSAWNTGLSKVPPGRSALLWWGYTPYEAGYPWGTPPLAVPTGPGRTAVMGDVYHHDRTDGASETKFPSFYDDAVFFADWNRDWIAYMRLDANGKPAEIQRFMANTQFRHPHDMAFGPDGSFYVLEWGVDFNYAGANVNPDSGLYRIDYAKGKRTPVIEASADRENGPAPLTVKFSSEGTYDPDGDTVALAWDFGDGATSTAANPTHTYTKAGTYSAKLTVTDATGKVATHTITINAGNTAPTVKVEFPENGGFFDFGDELEYKLTITDPEDATIACDRAVVSLGLFHAEGDNPHVHPGTQKTGCAGTVTTDAESGHAKSAIISQVVTGSYTDGGGQPGSVALSSGVSNRLNPKQMQMEHYAGMSGVTNSNQNTAQGGVRVGNANPGDWLYFEPMNFKNIDSISMLYSAGANTGGRVELRLGAPDGPVISTLDLPVTGSNNTYRTVTAPIAPTTGTHRVYFVFAQLAGGPANNLFQLDEMTFNGRGMAVNAKPLVSASASAVAGETPLAVSFTGTASDPDNDPLTYAWDFTSDGTVDATTKDASFVYTQLGTHTARFTATDANGRSASSTVAITVNAPPPDGNCYGPGSDRFNGSALDRTLWPTVVRDAPGTYTVGDGALNLVAGFGTLDGAGGSGPPVVLRPRPTTASWTYTTKLTFNPSANGEQAGVLLYQNDDNFIRLAHAYQGGRRIELVKEDGTVVTSANVPVPTGTPSSVYLRLTFSSGNVVRAFWSADGARWTSVGETTLNGITNPTLGVYANNGGAALGATPVAAFDWTALDDSVRPCVGEPVNVDVGGSVPATLALSIGAAEPLGPFVPGVAREYESSLTATVTSTAGDTTLSVSDAGPQSGRLVNGSHALAQPLQIRAGEGAFSPLGSPVSLVSYTGPVSNGTAAIGLKQAIGANDPLRTGRYSKALTFTLSTTTP
ncbi:ThuA domain-containing protein [Solirubrobacter sp. CPCC 204708]|uniref:ThuA domain-containing protein n=1 Tax=Solirubrobacter deserti TaxID=2282478 RepID=A0ABT4RP68_9ACTN|nr:ThuA domain-containing protein [Solirubrobacter deserti]MBE2315747.1 ThuA domain-containing protein [Solirubrobacter deserti]MDA0140363.1 ThuA domain-containing protein [Solirubrobacter deserti]